MGRSARVVVAALAFAMGASVAYLTRSSPTGRSDARPAAVERVVKALDRLVPATRGELVEALAAAGPASDVATPWREELELAALVLAGDRAGLEAFADASPRAPARARAWLRLATDTPDALDRLLAEYPDSAAARVIRGSGGGNGK